MSEDTERKKRKAISTCFYCKGPFYKSRSWQSFCSDRCRTNNFVSVKQESLQRDSTRREELEQEVERLQCEVKALKALVDKLQ